MFLKGLSPNPSFHCDPCYATPHNSAVHQQQQGNGRAGSGGCRSLPYNLSVLSQGPGDGLEGPWSQTWSSHTPILPSLSPPLTPGISLSFQCPDLLASRDLLLTSGPAPAWVPPALVNQSSSPLSSSFQKLCFLNTIS